MDNPFHPKFSLQEDQEVGGTTNRRRNKESKKFFWVKRVQARATADGRYQEDKLQLNLQKNEDGVLECRGRVQDHYPIFLPDGQRYTEK